MAAIDGGTLTEPSFGAITSVSAVNNPIKTAFDNRKLMTSCPAF